MKHAAETATLMAHAEIRGGHSFRGKIPESVEGEIAVVQIRDIDHEAKRIVGTPVRVKQSALNRFDDHLLTQEDVLLVARGSYLTATRTGKHIGAAVASASFLIIRPDPRYILPGYLAWFLNQERTQAYLRDRLGGSAIPLLNKAAIKQLPIVIPPLSVQEELAELVELVWQEEELGQHIRKLRQQQLSAVAQHLLD